MHGWAHHPRLCAACKHVNVNVALKRHCFSRLLWRRRRSRRGRTLVLRCVGATRLKEPPALQAQEDMDARTIRLRKELFNTALEQCNIEEPMPARARWDIHAPAHATNNLAPPPHGPTIATHFSVVTRSQLVQTRARKLKAEYETQRRVSFGRQATQLADKALSSCEPRPHTLQCVYCAAASILRCRALRCTCYQVVPNTSALLDRARRNSQDRKPLKRVVAHDTTSYIGVERW